MRDGLLGCGDEPLVPAVVPAQCRGAEGGLGGGREGDGRKAEDRPRKRLHRGDCDFYRDNDKIDHRTRAVAYEKAMEQVHQRYPDDREAGVFYSLALVATAPPTDKTYANQKKAKAILDKVNAELPNHPGVQHYLIHADDSPALAEDGLTAALCYATSRPRCRMPCTCRPTFSLGSECGSNRSTPTGLPTAAALGYVREEIGPDAFDGETVHYDGLHGIRLPADRTGPPSEAVVEQLQTFGRAKGPNLPMAYALAAIPARYAVERRNWPEAAALTPPSMPFPWERFPWAEAMISFTRALGAAHTGDVAGAETEIAKLQSLKEKLDQAKDDYWAKQVEVQRLAASGILAHAKGNDKQAVELVRAAADLDATMDKHPATPAEVLPARELLADLLLELNDPAAALEGIRAIREHRAEPLPQHPRDRARRQADRRYGKGARGLRQAGHLGERRRGPPGTGRSQGLPDELIIRSPRRLARGSQAGR